MKYILIVTAFLLTLMFSIRASAQESIIDEINYAQLEEYIALAKANYPRSRIMDLNEKKAKSMVPMETVRLLDVINVSYYYRPESKTAINPENPYVFNGVQFGVGVNLGSLAEKPFRIKQAKVDYEIAKLEADDYDKTLRLEVKNRYYLYVLQLKGLKLLTQAAQDAQAIADDISLRFERGEVELEDFSSAKSTLNSAVSAKIEGEVAYLFAKDQLEEIIGREITN